MVAVVEFHSAAAPSVAGGAEVSVELFWAPVGGVAGDDDFSACPLEECWIRVSSVLAGVDRNALFLVYPE